MEKTTPSPWFDEKQVWPWPTLAGLALGYMVSEHHMRLTLTVLTVACVWLGLWLRPCRLLSALALLGLLVGHAQVIGLEQRHHCDSLKDQDGLWVDASGVVQTSPSHGPKTVRFVLALDRIEDHPGIRPALVEVVLMGDKDLPEVAMGERWRMTGHLQAPPGEEYPDGQDRALQLARKGIWHQLLVPLRQEQCDRLVPPLADSPWGAVMRLRVKLVDCFRRRFQGRQAELLAGIVLGEAQGLDDELQQAFRATGTSHLLAASGANVMILLGVLLWISHRLGYSTHRVAFPCLGAVWLTVALAGFSPSVVRAGWMSAVALLATGLGRKANLDRCLSIGCLISLLLNPEYLFDVSFQLSAGAVICLATLGRAMALRFKNRLLKQVAITAAVLLGLWPVLAYHFQSCQPGALVANVLLAPPMESLLPLGLLLAGLDWLWPPLAVPLVWLCRAMLATVLWLVLKLAPLMPVWMLARPNSLEWLIWLLGTLGLLAWLHRFKGWAGVLWLGAVLLLLWQRLPSSGDGGLRGRVVLERRHLALWLTTPQQGQLLILEDPGQQAPLETMLRIHGVLGPDKVIVLPGLVVKPHKGKGEKEVVDRRRHTLRTEDGVSLDWHGGCLRLTYGRIRLTWGGTPGEQQLPSSLWLGDGSSSSLAPFKVAGSKPKRSLVKADWTLSDNGALQFDSDGVKLTCRAWI
jgi:ComEC/Rec2-related protein